MNDMEEHVEDRNYLYKLVGCDELSSNEQIITEYKLRAKALHPDKNSGDVETTDEFITLTKAKEILCDEEKRKQYDCWRQSGLDISFDLWLKTDLCNHMSMHWAPIPKKQKMIETREAHTETSKQRKKANIDRTSIPKTEKSCTKTKSWESKSSWGDSQLNSFRNYKI